jgi:hypothetical protein
MVLPIVFRIILVNWKVLDSSVTCLLFLILLHHLFQWIHPLITSKPTFLHLRNHLLFFLLLLPFLMNLTPYTNLIFTTINPTFPNFPLDILWRYANAMLILSLFDNAVVTFLL